MQFAVEIQATLWNAQEFSVETTQSIIQKSTPQQQEVVRLTHVKPKNPELGIYQTGKTNEPWNTSRNIYDHVFL